MQTVFPGCSSAEANTFLLNQALGKDFHPIFKFSAMEHYPFCTPFAVEEEKILSAEPVPIQPRIHLHSVIFFNGPGGKRWSALSTLMASTVLLSIGH